MSYTYSFELYHLFLLFFLDSTGKRQKTKQTFLCTADFSLHLLHFYFLYSLSEIATPLCCFWHSTWDEKHGPSSCKLFSSISFLYLFSFVTAPWVPPTRQSTTLRPLGYFPIDLGTIDILDRHCQMI